MNSSAGAAHPLGFGNFFTGHFFAKRRILILFGQKVNKRSDFRQNANFVKALNPGVS
jgi:hypothetical protein